MFPFLEKGERREREGIEGGEREEKKKSEEREKGQGRQGAIFFHALFPGLAFPIHMPMHCSLVSHFPYTCKHLTVFRNCKNKITIHRIQSQRQRGGFPSAQAIFFHAVFPCLAFPIHMPMHCSSVSHFPYTCKHLTVFQNCKTK